VLASKTDSVASAEPGVKQNVERHALSRAERPTGLEAFNFVFRPGMDAFRFDLEPANVARGVCRQVFHVDRPFELPSHRLDEIIRHGRGILAALASSDDIFAGNLGERLVAACFQDVLENILALTPGRDGQIAPRRRLTILVGEPAQRSRPRSALFWRGLTLHRRLIFCPKLLRSVGSAKPCARTSLHVDVPHN
jgi:hypothetical protein